MIELSRAARRAVLLVHVITSVGWLGAGAANLALAIAGEIGASPVPRGAAYLAVDLLDTWVVIPAAFTALLSGIVLSAFTSWGLVRHYWILVKLVLTCAIITFSAVGLGAWVQDLIGGTATHQASQEARALVFGATLNLAGFALMTWLSIAKPRGQTSWTPIGSRRQ